MAKSNNLPAKRYKAGERTERTLRFVWEVPNTDTIGTGHDSNVYIDIAKSLSAINRRFYRQGLYYYVSNAYFINGGTAHCQIKTIPDTYMTKLAWVRGFKAWSKMNRLAAGGDSIYPKYHDFKVRMTKDSASDNPLDPSSGDLQGAVTYACDEWAYSKMYTADPPGSDPEATDDWILHMVGSHSSASAQDHTSIGLIASLQDVWRYQASGDPEILGEADIDPIANLFDAGDNMDEIRNSLDVLNDAPPYDRDNMIGATDQDELTVAAAGRTSAGSGALTRMGGFCAPLGLLEVAVDDFAGQDNIGIVELVLEIAEGPYHGVYAERMI